MQTPPTPLAGTRWYVTAENLLAYLTDPALRVRTPVADQTLWSIASAEGGRFQGTSRTQLWVRAPEGGLRQMGAATTSTLDGTLSESGEITIVFTPDDPTQPRTTGYGHLRRVEGEWRMEMQMATGTQTLALHWAYMTPWTGGDAPAAPPEDALDAGPRSDAWTWMLGTSWAATDETLFPDGAAFTVGGYRNGYLWGEGAAAGGSTLRMMGSVTPEGSLYLLFSVADAPAEARRGVMASAGGADEMVWAQAAGGPVVGGARPFGGPRLRTLRASASGLRFLGEPGGEGVGILQAELADVLRGEGNTRRAYLSRLQYPGEERVRVALVIDGRARAEGMAEEIGRACLDIADLDLLFFESLPKQVIAEIERTLTPFYAAAGA